jgi:hypothetical protein
MSTEKSDSATSPILALRRQSLTMLVLNLTIKICICRSILSSFLIRSHGSASGAMSAHDHPNYMDTLGLGRLGAVMNGVPIRSLQLSSHFQALNSTLATMITRCRNQYSRPVCPRSLRMRSHF